MDCELLDRAPTPFLIYSEDVKRIITPTTKQINKTKNINNIAIALYRGKNNVYF